MKVVIIKDGEVSRTTYDTIGVAIIDVYELIRKYPDSEFIIKILVKEKTNE